MTRHKDSPAFIEYLKTVIPKFIAPLKSFTDKHHVSDSKRISGYSELGADFKSLGELFASLDEILSESKMLFIWDVVQFVNPEEVEEDWSNSNILEDWSNIESAKLYGFENLVIPRLNRYDAEHQTDSGLQARSMFFEYANAVCKADGLPLSKLQNETLSNFKDKLFEADFFEFDISPKEYRHENSAEFISYLETTITDLVPPLEEMKREIEGTDKPDARYSIIQKQVRLVRYTASRKTLVFLPVSRP